MSNVATLAETYFLQEGFHGGISTQIEKAYFDQLWQSREMLTLFHDIEDLFTIVATSYTEIEKYLLDIGVDYYLMLPSGKMDDDFFFDEVREKLNLRLLTLLNAARMYCEQVIRNLTEIFDNAKIIDQKPKLFFSIEFDKSIEYRLMDGLRNHASHSKLPIGSFTLSNSSQYESGRSQEGVPCRFRTTINPHIICDDVISSDRVNQKTRNEIKSLAAKNLDLKFFMRGYIAALARCQIEIRKGTDDFFVKNFIAIHGAQQKLSEAKNGEVVSHMEICKVAENRIIERFYVDPERIGRVALKRTRWTNLQHVQRDFVSSEVIQQRDTYPFSHDQVWISK